MRKSKTLVVVIDPNVFISASISKATRRKVFDIFNSKHIKVYYCPELIDEYHQVINRPKFRKYISIEQATRFIHWAIPLMQKAKLHTFIRLSRDENDNYLLSLAFDTSAHYLITGDNDLLVLNKFAFTQIITLQTFFSRLMSI